MVSAALAPNVHPNPVTVNTFQNSELFTVASDFYYHFISTITVDV